MNEQQFWAEQFEANRAHLQGIAYRMLGSLSEADDAVQETWLRFNRSDVGAVQNLAGWLTTVVARVCLDMLRARKARRETPLEEYVPEETASQERGIDPEQEALMAESVGLALLVVLQTLSPAERIAFVLHDMFDFPFEQIGPIVGRTPSAARQLASRARRRVRGQENTKGDVAAQRNIVEAFLAASRGGNFEKLLTLLDPEVVFRADLAAQAAGASEEIRGSEAVARFFLGRAAGARAALVDGAVGAVVAPRGRLFLVLKVEIMAGKVVRLEAVADAEKLEQVELGGLED
jgi:RNA polymerase sigma-70 factor (ECF subfamily)